MQAQLVFAFPVDVSVADAIHAVANHFAVGVSIAGAPANVPAHIKQAVESVGGVHFTAHGDVERVDAGIEPSAAIAFGALVNGAAAGNVQATPQAVQSSADVGTSTTAPVASPAISATMPPASSAPVLPVANAAVAPVASAATANPAGIEFDVTGLAWDARIHSGAKSKTPKGEWRTMKGCNKAIIPGIELELRAKYPNGAAPVANASPINAPVSVDPAAAYAYAHGEALRVAGPQLLDDATISAMNGGVQYTLSPEQGEWYSVYHAKRQDAYSAYMAGNVQPASVPPVAPISPQATGSEVAALAVTVPVTVVSQTAAVGTVAPATGVPLDATGLPHDKRIHIGTALKDQAGVWIQRHDVPGETKLLIMAELRAALAVPNADSAAQVSSTPAVYASTPVAPTPPVVQVVTAEEAGTDFAKMMQWITANVIAKRIAANAGPEAAKTLGFVGGDGNGALALMTQQAAYFPHVVMLLQGQGAI